jgi:hypothetical protein
VHLLSELLIAGWLNAGARNPKCFGIKPSTEQELEFVLFQAVRITLEHMFMMRKIPETNQVQGFDIHTLNAFIEKISPRVQIFWLCLLRVDISEIKKLPNEALV